MEFRVGFLGFRPTIETLKFRVNIKLTLLIHAHPFTDGHWVSICLDVSPLFVDLLNKAHEFNPMCNVRKCNENLTPKLTGNNAKHYCPR
jgi:hypothetical protein